MAFDQIPTSVTIINSGLIGYQGISLTDFTLSSASLIASGSAVEIAGAFFKASTDITPNASSWTSVITATTAYLELTPSGTAGSQVLTAAWSSTIPTWSTSKQGWYASAGSNSRTIASAYKNSNTSYSVKTLLTNTQNFITYFGWQGEVVKILSGSGNWTVPDGVRKIKVVCIGGGGGGGVGGINPFYAGGGGAGSIVCDVNASILNVTPGQLIAYSVGAGGASGSAGSDTTFTGAITGKGGAAGQTNLGLPGAGGALISAISASGHAGLGGGVGNEIGGTGGGAGGAGGYGGAGADGGIGGGGGGGGLGGFAGGAGGSGIILITY